MARMQTLEDNRLEEARSRTKYWKRWGPYLSERQWGTVREDYSAGGTAWEYFPHDHARSRAYRWGEDGLGGISGNLSCSIRECLRKIGTSMFLWSTQRLT